MIKEYKYRRKMRQWFRRNFWLMEECYWVWDGIEWQPDGNSCPEICECFTKPDNQGTFIGQPGFTACDCPEPQ